MTTPEDITAFNAQQLSAAIRSRTLSCREVMQAYLARIHRLNPRLNAIVNLARDDDLLRQADRRDAALSRGRSQADSCGWLYGMPQAIKDTGHAIGFPTTYGSPLLKDAIATQDSLMTARMKAAGCIVIGKTNMPEFGLGSHTFNTLFGATPNAWDASVSAGGSSGGAAVALAQRLLPVADGSDFMGSLRNPAAWNNVFGLRPSQGRVPFWPAGDVWITQLGTEGPMARSVADLTQLLAIQAGHDARVPLSIDSAFVPPVPEGSTSALKGLRIGWLGDLGRHLALEPGIAALCEQALRRCEGEGAHIEALTQPGFDANAVWQSWLVWRRALVAPRIAPLLQRDAAAREHIKAEALWEHDQAQGTSVMALMGASEARSTFLQQLLAMFERFDVLALPATQVWPFAIGERWPTQIAGRTMDTYHRWMEVTLYATFAGLPAISVPAGFHANGRWPAGLQLVGRPRGDAALLRIAAAYECTIGALLARRPQDA
jgi:amidase